MQERYQRALRRDAYVMDDPWQRWPFEEMEDEDIFSIGCLDPLPAGMFDEVATPPPKPTKLIQLSLI